jgi:hypothetical protein
MIRDTLEAKTGFEKLELACAGHDVRRCDRQHVISTTSRVNLEVSPSRQSECTIDSDSFLLIAVLRDLRLVRSQEYLINQSTSVFQLQCMVADALRRQLVHTVVEIIQGAH